MSRLLIITILSCFCLTLNAETITLKLGEQGKETKSEINMPNRGDTMEQVRQAFGEPSSIDGPTGSPQITTWHYEEFSVYFEDDYVIHSVIQHTRKY